MSNRTEYDDGDISSTTVETSIIPNIVRFWVFLIVLIPSLLCSLFCLGYTLFNGSLRAALHNHVTIVVIFIGLVYELTIYPWMLYYYQYEGIWHRSPVFCTIWSFIDWGLYYTQTILFAWATIERHILVFRHRWVATKWRRFALHYLPLILLSTYCLAFYITVSFFSSCENRFDDSYMICVTFCFADTHALYMWDAIVHQIVPNLLIAFFSVALLTRVLCQKYRVQRTLVWRKHRRMTVQLLSFSLLYLLFAFPLTLMNLMYLCGLPVDVGTTLYEFLLFFNYLMIPMLPFACVICIPGWQQKLRRSFFFRRTVRTIAPSA